MEVMHACNVVKRSGGTEEFDPRKVYGSIFLTCVRRSDHGKEECEDIAQRVTDGIAEKVADREEVLSVEIRMWGRNALREIDTDLAEAYYTHHIEE